jgi:uncharacterized protein
MKLTVFGATGQVGTHVVAEAVARGHDVLALVRAPTRARELPASVEFHEGNVEVVDDVAAACRAGDAAVGAVRPPVGRERELLPATESLLAGVAQAGVRLVLVGGAGSLTVPGTGGRTVLDDPRYLSPDYRDIARANIEQLDACRRQTDAAWTYLSPPASLRPGPRTGRYRIGTDELLVDASGTSTISFADLAVAIVDEVEQPRHEQQRFTVAGEHTGTTRASLA